MQDCVCFAKVTLGNLHLVFYSLILFLFIDLFAHKLFSLFLKNQRSLTLVARCFIEKDETTYEVENKAGVGFINTAMKGNLKIVKTSSDGKVEGFTFRVTGVNGYDRSFTTDKNGEIIIEGLRIGDYTISEVQDSVSASYVLPADKIATVKVGSTTVVEMHNELRDTPKTGDNSNVGLWTALAGLSALGIVGTAVVAYRKKKKEDNE